MQSGFKPLVAIIVVKWFFPELFAKIIKKKVKITNTEKMRIRETSLLRIFIFFRESSIRIALK